jgi:hypothetical protein
MNNAGMILAAASWARARLACWLRERFNQAKEGD